MLFKRNSVFKGLKQSTTSSSPNPPLQCECIVSIDLVDRTEISKLALVNDHINVTNSPLKHSGYYKYQLL
jgi:hypothetical protein